ncbi:MAG: hypothetical protein BGN88_04415 [Clostridiales bacterium 43-6]|nr:MAG: hypothetical protein BGN88_04415 [Clostridiales bacterium 43-6]
MTQTNIAVEEAIKFIYQMVECESKSDGAEGEKVYGIKAYNSCFNDDFTIIEDISANKHAVEQLMFRLNRGQVSPDQLFYIVEDYLDEMNTY